MTMISRAKITRTLLRNVLLAALPPIIWGACFPSNKITLEYFSPIQQVSLQLIASIVFLCLLITALGLWATIPRKEMILALFLGILEPGLTYYFGQTGMVTASPGIASIIFSSEAVITVFILYILRLSTPSPAMMGLAVLAFVGVCFIVGVELSDSPSVGQFSGYALVFLSVLMASAYAVMSSRHDFIGSALFIVLMQQVAALVLLVVISIATGEDLDLPRLISQSDIPVLQWLNLIAAGVAQFALAFAIFLMALTRLGPYMPVMFLNLIPISGLLAAYLLLGETLTPIQLLGTAVTLSALFAVAKLKNAQ